MDGESLFCSNVNHMRFLSLSTYCAAARPTFFFAASAASCTRVFFACLSTLGREETEKESLVTFFSVSLLSSSASKHLFVKPSVAQFWLFVRLHVLPSLPTHNPIARSLRPARAAGNSTTRSFNFTFIGVATSCG